MGLCSGLPRECHACSRRAGTGAGERIWVVEQPTQFPLESGDVARRYDRSRVEPANHLAESADVIHDGGHAPPERLEERPRLVEFLSIREDRDGCVAERLHELVGSEVAEAPLGPDTRLCAEGVERDPRVARDQESSAVDSSGGCERVGKPLVGSDHSKREHGAPVVGAYGIGAEHRVVDDAEALARDAKGG